MTNSAVAILMLFIGGLFVGGVISFVRNKQPLFAIGCGIAAVLAFAAGVMWWG